MCLLLEKLHRPVGSEGRDAVKPAEYAALGGIPFLGGLSNTSFLGFYSLGIVTGYYW